MSATFAQNRASIELADVNDLLFYIPSDDRKTWVRVGMVLRTEYGDASFELFDQWSQSSEKYSPKSVQDVWRSFSGSGMTLGTLVYLAKLNGWRPSRRKKRTNQKVVSESKYVIKKTVPQTDRSVFAKKLYLASRKEDQQVITHPYAVSKGLASSGGIGRGNASGKLIGRGADCLVVPIRNIDSGLVQGVECINPHGLKQSFGRKSGGALILGNDRQDWEAWYVLEGWASTYSTVFHHGKHTAVCAFGKSSLEAVAHAISRVYTPKEIVILREVDR